MKIGSLIRAETVIMDLLATTKPELLAELAGRAAPSRASGSRDHIRCSAGAGVVRLDRVGHGGRYAQCEAQGTAQAVCSVRQASQTDRLSGLGRQASRSHCTASRPGTREYCVFGCADRGIARSAQCHSARPIAHVRRCAIHCSTAQRRCGRYKQMNADFIFCRRHSHGILMFRGL